MVSSDSSISNAFSCQQLCLSNPQCYQWDWGNSICRLRDDTAGNLYKSDGFFSGTKNCAYGIFIYLFFFQNFIYKHKIPQLPK